MRIRAGEPSDTAFIVAMAQLASVIEDDPPPSADDPALLLGLPPSPDTAVVAVAGKGRGPLGVAMVRKLR